LIFDGGEDFLPDLPGLFGALSNFFYYFLQKIFPDEECRPRGNLLKKPDHFSGSELLSPDGPDQNTQCAVSLNPRRLCREPNRSVISEKNCARTERANSQGFLFSTIKFKRLA
jgi:hypothetical protein